MTTSEYRLARTGRAALVFNGECLAECEGRLHDRGENARAWTVRLYRTAGGKIVAAATYHSDWGEPDYATAEVTPDLATAEAWLNAIDPTAPVTGYPAGAQFVERQARLMADIRRRFAVAVGEALAEAGAEERVD